MRSALGLVAVIALGLVACGGTDKPATKRPGSVPGSWLLRILPGKHQTEAAGEAIAVAPDGDVAVVWTRGTTLTVARYDPRGFLRSTTRLADARCHGTPSFAPRVRITPDGHVVVAAALGVGKQICVIGVGATGTIEWATELAGVEGITHLAVDAAGQIAVAGKLPGAPANGVSLLAADGHVVAHVELKMMIEELDVTWAGTAIAIGRAVEDGQLADVDPVTPDVQSVEVVALDRRGAQLWARPLVAAPNDDTPLYLAVGRGDNVYVGWRTKDAQTGDYALDVAKLGPDGGEEWRRHVAAHGTAILAGGPGGLAVAVEQAESWTLLTFASDGTEIERLSAAGEVVKGEVPMRQLTVDALALGKDAVVAAGTAAKRASFGTAGTLTSRCKKVARREGGDPPTTVHDEVCSPVGFAVRAKL